MPQSGSGRAAVALHLQKENPLTNPNEAAAADKAAEVAQLLTLVSEMRGLRDRVRQSTGRRATFAEIAHSSIAGKSTTSVPFHLFLLELAAILDKETLPDVDAALAKEWQAAARAWLETFP